MEAALPAGMVPGIPLVHAPSVVEAIELFIYTVFGGNPQAPCRGR
jgi:hypothetical protein